MADPTVKIWKDIKFEIGAEMKWNKIWRDLFNTKRDLKSARIKLERGTAWGFKTTIFGESVRFTENF